MSVSISSRAPPGRARRPLRKSNIPKYRAAATAVAVSAAIISTAASSVLSVLMRLTCAPPRFLPSSFTSS